MQSRTVRHAVLLLAALFTAGCGATAKLTIPQTTGPQPALAAPNSTLIPTINVVDAKGWSDHNATPIATTGRAVAAFARDLDHPRWIYVLPNGDVLVAETNAPPRPDDGKGIKGWLFKRYQKKAGGAVRVRIASCCYATPTAMASLTSNHHWTKNVNASPDGSKLYVAVGSNSNAAENGVEKEEGRAAIWEVNPRTGAKRVYASGLRNPVGMAWEPTTGALWVAVNERDELGSDLVPDYITAVHEGGFYGWPYSYYGQHIDERVKPQRPELVATAIKPDYALGPHIASLGRVRERADPRRQFGPRHVRRPARFVE